MTDKQIIIDGTQCRYAHFDGGNTQRLLCAIDDCFCDCHRENDCYYKQLKAKEQECEELKRQHQADKGLITSTGKMNYQLLQEYDKLKTALTEIKKIAERCGKRIPLFEIDEIAEDLKQILQKISECEVE
jgi:hypothetical protein